jgi:hypothetical protein
MRILLSGNSNPWFGPRALVRLTVRRGHELICGGVYPTAFTGRISHHLKGNSSALVLSQHKTLRYLGILYRLQ